MEHKQQRLVPEIWELPWLSVNSGLGKDMARKKYHVIAKCYDKRGKLLSVGLNSYTKTHPMQKMYARKVGHNHDHNFLHAEIHAILKCKGQPIYRIRVERYDAKGLPADACPCELCSEAINDHKIKVIEYSSNGTFITIKREYSK